MGSLNEFSLPVRLFLKAYRWRRIHPMPWVDLEKPLTKCRLAFVSSAGFVLPGQARFDETRRGGDVTFREIPSDIDVTKLVDAHRSESFDHSGLVRDPNVAFPIDRVRELAEAGQPRDHRGCACINGFWDDRASLPACWATSGAGDLLQLHQRTSTRILGEKC
jgi:D-proline reductase (dithiol) PrdB